MKSNPIPMHKERNDIHLTMSSTRQEHNIK